MARSTCKKCLRPVNGCICHLLTNVNNDIDIIVLQHPKEVNHTKGTLFLLANSLSRCHVLVGEDFTENQAFEQLVSQYQTLGQVLLLYPSEQAQVLNDIEQVALTGEKVSALILLDATWKKAYRMYQLSKPLHNLPHLKMATDISGQYSIRKTTKNNALSTLEACCFALAILENDQLKYRSLLDNFIAFNEFQIALQQRNSEIAKHT